MEKMKMESLIEERGARGGLQPRFLRLEIGEEEHPPRGKTGSGLYDLYISLMERKGSPY